jgi:predicted nucleotidyltransferase
MHENLIRIKAVCQALKGLEQDYVFVGGATVALYATDQELAGEIRPTDDVDVIVELASYKGYSELDQRLVSLGFKNDVMSGVICRYTIQGIIVDVMPTNPDVIGFSNRWYPEGFATAKEIKLDNITRVKIFNLPYFVASKWEAFKGRGKNNYRTSKDFEDLVYILENVDDFEEQMMESPDHVKTWLREELSPIIETDSFEEGLYAHLTGGYGGIDARYVRIRLKDSFSIV